MQEEASNVYDLNLCPIGMAMEEIGDRWVLFILRACFFQITRFKDLQDHLGVSKSVLSTKLNFMVDKNLLERKPYKEKQGRTRFEYQLTKKGKGLMKVVAALMEWGNEYIKKVGDPTIVPIDLTSKKRVRLVFADREGNISKGYQVGVKPTRLK
ncbi:MAG: helix-turn-helix domain-containing protein [Bacteroidota bacterium]